jgi:hypothetical protein
MKNFDIYNFNQNWYGTHILDVTINLRAGDCRILAERSFESENLGCREDNKGRKLVQNCVR